MEVLALIAARGGSQRVPRKNIKLAGGKPLIAWTVEAAMQASCVTRCVVTTDDSEVAEVAIRYGADVPFMRPVELAQANSTSMDTVIHCLRWLEQNENYIPDYFIFLQPTSPLRDSTDIDRAFEVFQKQKIEAMVSVAAVREHPRWIYDIKSDGKMELVIKDAQFPESMYAPNGAIYIYKVKNFLQTKQWLPEATFAFVMPPEKSIDVDTPFDFKIADLLLGQKNEK